MMNATLETLTISLLFFAGYVAMLVGCALDDVCSAANGLM